MDYNVQTMSLEDYEEVYLFWNEIPGIGLSQSDSKESIQRYLERNPGLSWVVRDQGKVIAAVLCGHDGRRGSIYHLAVAEAYRHQGIAKMLINQCLSGLAQQQIDKCNLVVFNHNESGLSFWRSNDWNQRTDLVVMQMTLG